MKVVGYSEEWKESWDDFVRECPEATFFHDSRWQVAIEKTFGYRPCHIIAHENGRIRAILPLFLFSNPILGRSLISTPFATYGGVCADSSDSFSAVLNAAVRKAEQDNVRYLELRARTTPNLDGFNTKTLYVSFDGDLTDDVDAMMAALPRDTRYMIRRATKSGLRAEFDNKHLDLCYDIYAYSVHQLGTPVFPRRYFHILRDLLRDDLEVLVVWKEAQAIAAVLSFRFRDWIIPYYGGSLAEGRRLAANNFMYWELMKNAARLGFRRFDFGRSKINTGAHSFKTGWNMRESPLPYQYYLVQQKTLPNYSPANPKFQFAIRMWKRMPLSVSKVIGPSLVRLFP